MKVPHKTLEKKLFAGGYQHVIGVDEVGMGCLAGPSVVCAVVFTAPFYNRRHRKLQWLRDSKLLPADQREKYAAELMAELLKDSDFRYHIAQAPVELIDAVNIYQATREAMRQAIAKLNIPAEKAMVLVDGNKKIQDMPYEQTAIIKGDRKVFAIACASVIAKVYRDKLMNRLAKKYPGYGLEQHKGYATPLHRQAIGKLGPSVIHRKSFKM